MKDKIYTIPISEAFEKRGICPFCTIRHDLDIKHTEGSLGAGMMEPSVRVMTNKQGFCKKHYNKMRELNQVLPLSLVIQSHLSENVLKTFDTEPVKKKTIFGTKTSKKDEALQVIEKLKKHNSSCYICSKIENTLNDYADTMIYMFKTDNDFRKVLTNTDSFCMEHTQLLLESAVKNLNEKDFEEFFSIIKTIQQKTLNRLYESISEFANSFDYRATEPLSKNAKNSITDSIDIL